MSNLHASPPCGDAIAGPASERDPPLGLEGYRFSDLHRVDRLAEIDALFLRQLTAIDPDLAGRLQGYRRLAARPPGADGLPAFLTAGHADLGATLIAVGPHLDAFLARLFAIEGETGELNRRATTDQVIFECRRQFLERRFLHAPPSPDAWSRLDPADLERSYREIVARRTPGEDLSGDPELELATVAMHLVALEERISDVDPRTAEQIREDVGTVGAWARALAFHPKIQDRGRGWTLFFRPEKRDHDALIPFDRPDPALPWLIRNRGASDGPRGGVQRTGRPATNREALGEMHYCILCHERAKDSCRHGFPEPGGAPAAGKLRRVGEAPRADGTPPHAEPITYRRNPLGTPLTGCPLDERISEAQLLRRSGHPLAALAMIMVENPLCAGTGDRICNDCMMSCIYQRQTPVHVPRVETNILRTVLDLPWGFEIHALLQRWNPLNVRRPFSLPYNGHNILVVGMGPAGYTLAHHLLNEGFGVIGVDAVKIEPLPADLAGTAEHPPRPVRHLSRLIAQLERRPAGGFGGVSEYGITARWDTTLLALIHLALARRETFRLFDGLRFGGALTLESCWRLGIDHVALATGAGHPNPVPMRNGRMKGVRQATDLLVALHGSGACRPTSLANVQVELPALVIGGGLTSVDTATAVQACYIVQVERALARWETLTATRPEAELRQSFNAVDGRTMERWLEHGRALRAERAAAAAEGRAPDLARLVREWGGVTIVYRKRIQESPAYRLNHEELTEGLGKGIGFAECLVPLEAHAGAGGDVEAVTFERQAVIDGRWTGTGDTVRLPARSVLLAAGTRPNTDYENEHPGTFRLGAGDAGYQGHRLVPDPEAAGGWHLEPVERPGEPGFFTSYARVHEGRLRLVSVLGDSHPVYAGSVARAMASARHGFDQIRRLFLPAIDGLEATGQGARDAAWRGFCDKLENAWTCTVLDVLRLAPSVLEIVFHAPLAARQFRPGQFFRLQNYEAAAPEVAGVRMVMDALWLAGHWVDRDRGLLSTIVMETGGSSRLCALLAPGERVVLPGPSGAPLPIPSGQTVLLAGSDGGHALLLSVTVALHAAGNRILYFAGFRRSEDAFKRREIERASDVVVWCTDHAPALESQRPQDRAFIGPIAQAIGAYGNGLLGPIPIPLHDVTRVLAVGSRMERESFDVPCLSHVRDLEAIDFDRRGDRPDHDSAAGTLGDLWLDALLERRLVEAAAVDRD